LLRPNLNEKEQKILDSLEGLVEKKTLSESEFQKKKEDLYNKAKERIEKEKKEELEKLKPTEEVNEKKKVIVKKKFSELTEEEKKKVMDKRDKTTKHLTDTVAVKQPEKLEPTRIRKDLVYAILVIKENHPDLKEVDFTDIQFNETQSNDLFQALEKNTNVTRLLMTNTNLSDKSIKSISQVIKNNKTITMIDLEENNNITSDGMNDIIEAFKSNQTITELLCPTTCSDEQLDMVDEYADRNYEKSKEKKRCPS